MIDSSVVKIRASRRTKVLAGLAVMLGSASLAWSGLPSTERPQPAIAAPEGRDDTPLLRLAATRSWYEGARGYGSALRRHERRREPMIVYFRVDWCPHCRKFDQILTDREVERALRPFVKVRINPETGDDEMELFRNVYGGRGYPSVYVHPAGGGLPVKISTAGPADKVVARLERFTAKDSARR